MLCLLANVFVCSTINAQQFSDSFESGVFIHADPNVLTFDGTIPGPDPDGASFRIKCSFSHANYDDPIVFPLEPDRSHLHAYLGNELADAFSDGFSLLNSGQSTCQGDYLNRSAYWTPAILAPQFDAGGTPLQNSLGEPLLHVVTPTAVGVPDSQPDIYYKANVNDVANIQAMPAGLRMIAGNGQAGPQAPQDLRIIRWWCESTPITSGDDFLPFIPQCDIGDMVNLSIFFPSCWDGVNLDITDHASHMAYSEAFPDGNGGFTITCPSSHPVRLAQVSYNMGFPVTAANADPTGGSGSWRIASDHYDTTIQPGGYSMHGDWFMAWNQEITETWARECLRAGRDCAGGALGNGWRLLGPFDGSGSTPEVVNCGAGPAAPPHDC